MTDHTHPDHTCEARIANDAGVDFSKPDEPIDVSRKTVSL